MIRVLIYRIVPAREFVCVFLYPTLFFVSSAPSFLSASIIPTLALFCTYNPVVPFDSWSEKRFFTRSEAACVHRMPGGGSFFRSFSR
jgi:hypothetical protein